MKDGGKVGAKECEGNVGNDGDDEQQVSQPRHLLTFSPLPVVEPPILCGSPSFSTQVSTPVSGVSTSWLFPNPSTFNPDLFLEHHFEYSGTYESAINVIFVNVIDLVGSVTITDM